jgi:septal ring-binding cell division protein DamX
MENKREEQHELFQEFTRPSRGIRRIRERYSTRRTPFIAISIEHAVFAGIAIILAIVIFFSLGVERGKQLGKIKAATRTRRLPQASAPVSGPGGGRDAHSHERRGESGAYTVQIVTYKNESAANRKIVALKKEGLRAFIIPKKGLFQVCVGTYGTSREAVGALKKLRSQYKDCFVRNTD